MRIAGHLLARSCIVLLVACGDDAESSGSGAGGAGGSSTQGGGGSGTGAGGDGGASSTGAGGVGGVGGAGAGEPTGDPLFVAVGYGGRRMISTDGSTWTNDVVVNPMGGDDDDLFRGVGFGDGVIVAVGGAAEGQIFTSTDGVAWTERAAATSWLGDVAFEEGVFVAAGGNGLRQRSTDLGETWIDQGPYYAGHFRGIASGDGIVVAAGHTYGSKVNQGLVARSTDLGETWEPEVVGGPQFGSIAFGAGRFVAAGQSGCRSSADGVEWQDCGVTGDLGRVVFVNDRFILPDGEGLNLSDDGITWTHADGTPRGVTCFGEGVYLAVDWPDVIRASPDLENYAVVNENTGPAFVEIAFGRISSQP